MKNAATFFIDISRIDQRAMQRVWHHGPMITPPDLPVDATSWRIMGPDGTSAWQNLSQHLGMCRIFMISGASAFATSGNPA